MEDGQPSQTALAAAAARAAHLVVDQEPLIFRDPVAADLIGGPGAEMVGHHRPSGDHIVLSGTRAQVTVRSRYTGQRLAELAADGLTQYVLLGAGFFTPEQLSELLEGHGMKVTERLRQQDAVPAALWHRSDALRPADLCRLARATVSK